MPKEIPSLANLATNLAVSREFDKLGSTVGDRRDGRVYVHDERIRVATRVAVATGRPLLLRGPAGSGKSSLAPFMARALGWRFYSFTVTARTQARDLMWQFDALRRLSDAQVRRPGDTGSSKVDTLDHYVEPGPLWWAIDQASAARRGVAPSEKIVPAVEPAKDPAQGPLGSKRAVILIDEIDKADPDLPNNLLEPLGSLQFTVQETGRRVSGENAPLVFVTTNNERELPSAFYRRCAVLYLKEHGRHDLIRIAQAHFDGYDPPLNDELAGRVADIVATFAGQAAKSGARPPSTAEYLDAVRACLDLGADPQTPGEWEHIAQLTLSKTDPFAK